MTVDRFIQAQAPVWESVVTELESGQKLTHWSWFVFPQIQGLGESAMSKKFAISSLEEALVYWRHPVLGPRLRRCLEIMLSHHRCRTPVEILGPVDAMKLRACLTLFEMACHTEYVFAKALILLFQNEKDRKTIEILSKLLSKEKNKCLPDG